MFKDKYDLFQHVKTHLLNQRVKALHPLGQSCVYRDSKGLSCAVGCCIPDDYYSPDMEGEIVNYQLFTLFPQLEYLRPYKNLLKELQAIHDGCPNDEWPDALNLLETQLSDY